MVALVDDFSGDCDMDNDHDDSDNTHDHDDDGNGDAAAGGAGGDLAVTTWSAFHSAAVGIDVAYHLDIMNTK